MFRVIFFPFPLPDRKKQHLAPGVHFCFEIRNYKELEITEGDEEIYYVVQISLMQLYFYTISYRTLYVILCNLSIGPHSYSLIQGSIRQSEKLKAGVMLSGFQALCSLEELIKLIDSQLACNANFCPNDLLVAFRQYELLSHMSQY